MEAISKYKFQGRWVSIKCRPGNVDIILRHFTADGVPAVTVRYVSVLCR